MKNTVNHALTPLITKSWSYIAPFWPLKNLIAVNPLSGFEKVSFKDALIQAHSLFQYKDIPQELTEINRHSIKWLQAFFDAGQATISMPNRHLGLLNSVRSLLEWDTQIHKNKRVNIDWLTSLPQESECIIAQVLKHLEIPATQHEQFLVLMLTTLPGWASYVQYQAQWSGPSDSSSSHPVTQSDYLAFRLIITYLLWPQAKYLLEWHQTCKKETDIQKTERTYEQIQANESSYQKKLFTQLDNQKACIKKEPKAQVVFCIDVRSEPFRRALEEQKQYQTYGFAGFFGIPASVKNDITGTWYTSCPVLLTPSCTIVELPVSLKKLYVVGYNRLKLLKKIYQSLKYTFTTPFNVVETLGIPSGLWMGIKCFVPRFAHNLKSKLHRTIASHYKVAPDISSIAVEQQVTLATEALKVMGLTKNFAPLVVFCAHGSTTTNNAYATMLNCGACAGQHGSPNARMLAEILNTPEVRKRLEQNTIIIPATTFFLAAEHNTTTDSIKLFDHDAPKTLRPQIATLKEAFKNAGRLNSFWRSKNLHLLATKKDAQSLVSVRAYDWSQVRPEWGLAKNASFIIGPRSLTEGIDLEGRTFLHSYDWQEDADGSLLTTILTGPVIVAQWINAQYLFSTLDIVAFGSGSKITQNITGKLGIMQGNASDLMTGLPLQSVYVSDAEPYHEMVRLTVIIYAPTLRVSTCIKQQDLLQKLVSNCWITVICYDPETNSMSKLKPDHTWQQI